MLLNKNSPSKRVKLIDRIIGWMNKYWNLRFVHSFTYCLEHKNCKGKKLEG